MSDNRVPFGAPRHSVTSMKALILAGFTVFGAGLRELSTPVALPTHLLGLMADAQRRREERRMAMMVEELGHPGVIADYQWATRG